MLTQLICNHCHKSFNRQHNPLSMKNIFCSKSCAAQVNNNLRSKEQRIKQSVTLKERFKQNPRPKNPKSKFSGPYSTLYINKCAITGIIFCSPTYQKYHVSALTTKKLYSTACRFSFSLSCFPEEFDFDLLRKFGMYKATNHGNNLTGVSRDHLYSVNDGWINKIDPTIIKHPANCRLITHRENQSKYKNSIISLNELYLRIEKWNLKYGRHGEI